MRNQGSIALAMLCAASISTAALAQEFVQIEPLDGDDWIRVRGISADGSVAAGTSYAGAWTNGRAIMWTPETGTVALPSEGNNSYVADMSADGTTIIGGITGMGNAIRWVNGEMEVLPVQSGVSNFGVIAVNGDGSVIVGEALYEGEFTAVKWTSEGVSGFDGIKRGAYSFATAVSEDGTVITGLSEYDAAEGFRWTEATGLEWLGFLPSGSWHSTIVSMSADGGVMGGQSHVSPDNYAAAIWTSGSGWTEIPSIIPSSSFANAIQSISADGSIMVGYNSGSSPSAWVTIMYDQTNGVRLLQDALEEDYGIDFGDWDISGNNPFGANIANVGVSSDGKTFYGSTYHPETGEEASWIAYTESTCVSADINCDGAVNVMDLLMLLDAWGACPQSDCPADLNGDGAVDVFDLLILLENWG